jgi:hypothetical protein
MKVIKEDDIARLGQRVRRPDGTPAVERKEEKPDEVANALRVLAESVRLMQDKKPGTVVVSMPNGDLLASSIVRLLKQNAELMDLVREAMKPEVVEHVELPPCKWAFEMVYDPRGKLTHVNAKEIK